LSDRPPHLPKSIDFFGPFDKMAQVRVLSETNVGSNTFPLVFTCELRAKLNGAAASNELSQVAYSTVNVRAIRLNSVPQVRTPKTKGKTAAGEARLSSDTGDESQVVYFSTADRLPEQPEAEAIKQYKLQNARH
jgi:hypothetical protein